MTVEDAIVELANATAALVANNRDALLHRRALDALAGLTAALETLAPADSASAGVRCACGVVDVSKGPDVWEGSTHGVDGCFPIHSKLHELKCWPEFFRAIVSGEKKHEVRHDDRGYRVGDRLWLREWDPKGREPYHSVALGTYTGSEIVVRVTYVAHGGECPGLENVPKDVAVMSIASDDDTKTGTKTASDQARDIRRGFVDLFEVVLMAQYLGWDYTEAEHVKACGALAQKYEPLARKLRPPSAEFEVLKSARDQQPSSESGAGAQNDVPHAAQDRLCRLMEKALRTAYSVSGSEGGRLERPTVRSVAWVLAGVALRDRQSDQEVNDLMAIAYEQGRESVKGAGDGMHGEDTAPDASDDDYTGPDFTEGDVFIDARGEVHRVENVDQDSTSWERVESWGAVSCGAVSVYSENPLKVTRCHLISGHTGSHRADSPSGQRYRWTPEEPTPEASSDVGAEASGPGKAAPVDKTSMEYRVGFLDGAAQARKEDAATAPGGETSR